MKSILIALMLILTTVSFGKGPKGLPAHERPTFLNLEKVSPLIGGSYFRHRNKGTNTSMEIKFESEELVRLNEKLLTNTSNVYCDGDFELKQDESKRPYVSVKSISVCIDQEGWLVGDTKNRALPETEVQRKATELAKRI